MDAITQQRMQALADQAIATARSSGVCGYCIDDGAESGQFVLEFDIGDCHWVALNDPDFIVEPYRSNIARLARSRNNEDRRRAAELCAYIPHGAIQHETKIKFYGDTITPAQDPTIDTTTRELKAEFAAAVDGLVQEGFSGEKVLQEWLWRKSEQVTGVKRPKNKWVEVNPLQQAELRRKHDAIAQRFRRAGD